jgi:hypothetical protein
MKYIKVLFLLPPTVLLPLTISADQPTLRNWDVHARQSAERFWTPEWPTGIRSSPQCSCLPSSGS